MGIRYIKKAGRIFPNILALFAILLAGNALPAHIAPDDIFIPNAHQASEVARSIAHRKTRRSNRRSGLAPA
jgi:hypothetical protein